MGVAWPASGLIERDNNDDRATGALAYFFVGGTTTPLTVYMDSGESVAHSHPVAADANGRWPLVFIPFADSYDIRVTTSSGTQLYYYVEIPNPAPVEQATLSLDTTQLITTGDIIFNPASGTSRTGFVRCNARTIGSATSGASERANADTATLFAYLWNNFADSICAVSTGRGATAAADFAANKTITLLDFRSSSPLGLDDMGNAAASRLSLVTVSPGSSTTGGSTAGADTHTTTIAQLPVVTPAGSVADTRTWSFPTANVAVGSSAICASAASTDVQDHNAAVAIGAGSLTFTGTSFGSGTAHPIVHRSILGNWLQRL